MCIILLIFEIYKYTSLLHAVLYDLLLNSTLFLSFIPVMFNYTSLVFHWCVKSYCVNVPQSSFDQPLGCLQVLVL